MKTLCSAQRNNDKAETLTEPMSCHVFCDGLFTLGDFQDCWGCFSQWTRMSCSKWLQLREEKQQSEDNEKQDGGLITGRHQKKKEKKKKSLKWTEIHDAAWPFLLLNQPKRGLSFWSAMPESGFLWFLWPLAFSDRPLFVLCGASCLGEHTGWLGTVLF